MGASKFRSGLSGLSGPGWKLVWMKDGLEVSNTSGSRLTFKLFQERDFRFSTERQKKHQVKSQRTSHRWRQQVRQYNRPITASGGWTPGKANWTVCLRIQHDIMEWPTNSTPLSRTFRRAMSMHFKVLHVISRRSVPIELSNTKEANLICAAVGLTGQHAYLINDA